MKLLEGLRYLLVNVLLMLYDEIVREFCFGFVCECLNIGKFMLKFRRKFM